MFHSEEEEKPLFLSPAGSNSPLSCCIDMPFAQTTGGETSKCNINNDDKWSKAVTESYLQKNKKLTIDDFLWWHGINTAENPLARLFVQIAKQQYVVLTDEFFCLLSSGGDDTAVRNFFALPPIGRANHGHNDEEVMISARDFETWLSFKNCYRNHKIASLYFFVNDLYRQHCDYERNWFVCRLESTVCQQSEKVDRLFALLAGKGQVGDDKLPPPSSAQPPGDFAEEARVRHFSDNPPDFWDVLNF